MRFKLNRAEPNPMLPEVKEDPALSVIAREHADHDPECEAEYIVEAGAYTPCRCGDRLEDNSGAESYVEFNPGRCQVRSGVRGRCTRWEHEDAQHEYNDLDEATGRWAGNSPSHLCTQDLGPWASCSLLGGHKGDHVPHPHEIAAPIPVKPPHTDPDDRPQRTKRDIIQALTGYSGPAEVLAELDAPEHDPVNHPSHYTSREAFCRRCGTRIECIDISETFTGNLAQVVQYVWRHEDKGGIEDLRKARWFLDREIARRARGGVTS